VIRLTDEQDEIIGGSTIIRVGEQLNTFYMHVAQVLTQLRVISLYWVYDDKEDEGDRSKHYVSSDKTKAAASRVLLWLAVSPIFMDHYLPTLSIKDLTFSHDNHSIGGKDFMIMWDNNYTNPLYIGNKRTREVLRAWKQPGDIHRHTTYPKKTSLIHFN